METGNIKLIIKSSNQLIEDQIVMCKLNWNVHQLKTYLSKVYPNKPEPKIQKLIYNGQYLDNSLCLKTIFSIDQLIINNAFTVYLIIEKIYMIKENEYLGRNLSDDERFRKIPESVLDYFNYEHRRLNRHQIVWIQQVYKCYILNYMHFLSTQRFPIRNVNSYYNSNCLLNIFNHAEIQRQSLGLDDTDVLNNNNNNNSYNNNNHNVHNNNNMNDEGRPDIEPGNNRDWLDNFYILSRVIILFSIVYFYASPIRFIVVTFLGFLIYLYHNRYFRNLQSDQGNHERNRQNNDQLLQNQNDIHVERAMRHISEDENEISDRINRNNDNPNNRPGALLFIWIFVSTFFTSMIPEQPNMA